jgi:hypothetical protein
MGVTQARQLKALKRENQQLNEASSRSGSGQGAARRGIPGKLLSSRRRRQAVTQLQSKFQVLRTQGLSGSSPRCSQRYVPTLRADEDALRQAIVALAAGYGRYGYRRVTALLKNEAVQ